MTDLLTRLLAATGPDRDLDLDILNSRRAAPYWSWLDRDHDTIIREDYGPGAVGNPVASLERFTGCMEDALTLLPPSTETRKHGVTVWFMPDGTGRALVWCQVRDDGAEGGWAMGVVPGNPGLPENKGATPALAVCVAALRARATEGAQ